MTASRSLGFLNTTKRAAFVATVALLSATPLVGCGGQAEGAAPDADGEQAGPQAKTEEVGKSKAELQWAYGQFAAFDVNNVKSTVSAVIRMPWATDGSTWASCGATFISKHYAVTASHCVPNDHVRIDNNDTMDQGDQTVIVSNINVSTMVNRINAGDQTLLGKLYGTIVVGGTWPSYTHPNPAMTSADGYEFRETLLSCRARVRCSSTYGKDNCPPGLANANGGAGVDIALIHCADRKAGAPWTTVFTGNDVVNTPVDVHWSHELLNLSTQANDGIVPAGNFDHYGAYTATDAGKQNNWHYRGLITNYMYPLVSKTWSDGVAYKTTGLGFADTEMWTDAFGCHGTSGSGVFNANSNQILGPVVHGGTGMNGRLCLNAVAAAHGGQHLSYVRPFLTRQAEALVTYDR